MRYIILLLFVSLFICQSCQKKIYCSSIQSFNQYRCTSPNSLSNGFDENSLDYDRGKVYIEYIGSSYFEKFNAYELILKRKPSAIKGEKRQGLRIYSSTYPKNNFLLDKNNPSSYFLDKNQAVILEDGLDELFLIKYNKTAKKKLNLNLSENFYFKSDYISSDLNVNEIENVTIHKFRVDYHYFNFYFINSMIFPITESKDSFINIHIIEKGSPR